MKRPILLVLALEQENHQQLLNSLAAEVMYTGVGKVNATLALTHKLSQMATKPLVINVGSAGSHRFDAHEVICLTDFVQRDMDATAIGFSLGQTPFEEATVLSNGLTVEGLPLATCYTGDSFVTEAHPQFHLEVIDMEAYALAKVCQHFDVPFLCLKFITDGADGEAADDWQQAVIISAHKLHAALHLALPQLSDY
jgi:adenosylhomocysteine nucleosidase